MEQCACVERELEKVLHRFVMYGHQSEERLDELLRSVCEIRGQLVAFGKKKIQTVHIYRMNTPEVPVNSESYLSAVLFVLAEPIL